MSTDRVIRSLRTHFDIAEIVRNGGERYELRGWAPHHSATGAPVLSLHRRAQALAPGLCAQCGRSPLKDGVRLEVDLMVPPEWAAPRTQRTCSPCAKSALRASASTWEPTSPTPSRSGTPPALTSPSGGSVSRWEYKVRKAYGEGARIRVYYKLVRAAPWPENIRAAITAAKRRRGQGPAGADSAQ